MPWYFAYGSNNIPQLSKRLGKAKLHSLPRCFR